MQKDLSGLSKEEKRGYWRDWVQKWKCSGEDKTVFCRNQDLNYDLFTYYSRRYASQKKEAALVPAKLTSSQSTYELVFPSGVILRFSANLSLPDLVRSVRDAV